MTSTPVLINASLLQLSVHGALIPVYTCSSSHLIRLPPLLLSHLPYNKGQACKQLIFKQEHASIVPLQQARDLLASDVEAAIRLLKVSRT